MSRFFEDYRVGEALVHATPRTLTEGERALYHAFYPARMALTSSDAFARDCGWEDGAPLDEMIVFHTVFGRSVPDVSLNAVANLGYAECRFLRPVWPGETLRAVSEVIGLKENSNGRTGIVWVRTTGLNQMDEPVLSFVRWVMVRKRDADAPAPETVVPELADAVSAQDLVIPEGLDLRGYDPRLAGSFKRARDHAAGEVIEHPDGVTVEEAEHMMATRLWQNTAKVHFDATVREDGRRLVYGGHVISLARTLSFDGLENACLVAGINAGSHANPCFAGTTVRAWSEVLEMTELREDVAAVRLRLVATDGSTAAGELRGEDGRYLPGVLLDLDYWALMPA
ncbi:MaoC family dehydratase [Jannaschia sp. Os4]|uniref:MaoC family dehydratase n=1 Tax=Jannaschia sp. Os4 TaxID=2807617 RepID=UPI0019396331|nr:MaoC family dehydratase [Jannaschia sp. Os4]